MNLKQIINQLEDTTSASAGTTALPIGSRWCRKRKGKGLMVVEWKTTPVHGDPDKWQVKVGKRWVTGVWRTVRGHRRFFKDGGGTLPKHPFQFKKKIKEHVMGNMQEVLGRLMEGAGEATASKQLLKLVALDMVQTSKVERRLTKLIGEFNPDELSTMLEPILAHWLEKQGVKVTGAAAAARDLKAMAKE